MLIIVQTYAIFRQIVMGVVIFFKKMYIAFAKQNYKCYVAVYKRDGCLPEVQG